MSQHNHPDEGARQQGEAANPSSPTTPCPHCGQPVTAHTRRCPHCHHLLTSNKGIARPEKLRATEGNPAWDEAAAQVADLGEITWHDGVHPINMDTRPVEIEDSMPPIFSAYTQQEIDTASDIPRPTVADLGHLPPRRPPMRWGALSGALFILLALLGLVLLISRQQQQTAAKIAAEATHQASLVGNSSGGNGHDGITPPATSQPIFSSSPTPTKTLPGTPTPDPTPAPTATTTPVPTATPLPTPTATPLPVLVYAIDTGGKGTPYSYFRADTFYNGGNTYYSQNPVDTSRVTNPAPSSVYQSERYGVFSYVIPQLQPGAAYTVRLHFAEIYFSQPGQRVFNVSINNALVLDNFDIVQQAGGPNIAIIEQFTTTADPNGNIVINFTQGPANWPKISGLEIYTAA